MYPHNFARWPTSIPLCPGINPSPSPDAELSLYLDFCGTHYKDDLARWETLHRDGGGDGLRPICVTLRRGAVSDAETVCRFTQQLVAALAPAPARGVSSLMIEGSCFDRGYWERVLSGLPGLRRLACAAKDVTQDVLDVLGKRSSSPGGRFPCALLEDLVLGWDLRLDGDSGLGEAEWQSMQRGSNSGDRELSKCGSQLGVSLSEFCDALGGCLAERSGQGCAPIQKLSLSLVLGPARNALEGWQTALVEQRLRHALGHLVESILVANEVNGVIVSS